MHESTSEHIICIGIGNPLVAFIDSMQSMIARDSSWFDSSRLNSRWVDGIKMTEGGFQGTCLSLHLGHAVSQHRVWLSHGAHQGSCHECRSDS